MLDDFTPEMIVRNEKDYYFVLKATKYINNLKTMTYIFLKKRFSIVAELIQESM